eukprot:m.67518 g.67518  ORF g.67518 m.67518 type:complete len:605 (+) comp19812_c0_seq3:416-2230(+)
MASSSSQRLSTDVICNATVNTPLPVPPLHQTLARFRETVTTLLTDEQLADTDRVLKEFGKPGGEGEVLQAALMQHAAGKLNWLEKWWLEVAYLGYRSSAVVNSNPGATFPVEGPTGKPQVQRAAQVVYGAVQYWFKLQSGGLPQEKGKHGPLCMSQFDGIFSNSRIPKPGCDEQLKFSPAESNHMIVMRNGHFYQLPLTDNGQTFSIGQLTNMFEQVLAASTNKRPLEVGTLTSANRDHWAEAYGRLALDPTNAQSLEKISKAAFVVCLDDEDPQNDDEEATLILTGSARNAMTSTGAIHNRWNDKMQFIITPAGKGGILMEHSTLDAPAAIKMLEDALQVATSLPLTDDTPAVNLEISSLPFNLSPEMENDIAFADKEFRSLAANTRVKVFHFRDFGKKFFKSQKLSPDASMQVALQLAYTRLHGSPPPTYETAHTRRFHHGRTETIRSASIASKAFTDALLDGQPTGICAKLFREAVASHSNYTQLCMNGEGVDRHLLGLKLIASQLGKPIPELFSHISWTRSTHHNLSTSAVAMKINRTPLFGPTAEDGYGVCYNVRPDEIYAGMSRFASCGSTCLDKFADSLTTSLRDIERVLVTPLSKL